MEIINVDKNGKVIPDLKKVNVPKELQIKVIKIMRSDQYDKRREEARA